MMLSLRSLWLTFGGALAVAGACASMPGGGTTPPPEPRVQARGITVYDGLSYRGRSATLSRSWAGGGYWDRRIRSVRVPAGYRVTLYTEPNFRGTETRLTENWAPSSPTAYWVGKARSFRIDRAEIQPVRPLPPTPPGGSGGTLPTAYTGAGYRGRVRSAQSDWPGEPTDSQSPFAIVGSIRVPRGWRVIGYSEPNYRGQQVTLTGDWTGRGMAFRSMRVYPPRQIEPR